MVEQINSRKNMDFNKRRKFKNKMRIAKAILFLCINFTKKGIIRKNVKWYVSE